MSAKSKPTYLKRIPTLQLCKSMMFLKNIIFLTNKNSITIKKNVQTEMLQYRDATNRDAKYRHH